MSGLLCQFYIFSLNEKSKGSPSAAGQAKADEKQEQEKQGSDRDVNFSRVSQAFLLRFSSLADVFYERIHLAEIS